MVDRTSLPDEREWDGYLRELSEHLRGWERSRRRVCDELRDHLEECYGDFCASGLTAAEAVARALDELGAADELAGAFYTVHRDRRRRWLMRYTTGSFAALLALAMAAMVVWPEGDGLTVRTAQAQDPGAASSEASIQQRNADTEARLSTRIGVDFDEEPLEAVLAFVADQFDLQVYVNQRTLDDLGVSLDTPISLSLREVRGDMLLDLVLDQADSLAYFIRDGIVVISTEDDMDYSAELQVYNCRDLVSYGPAGNTMGSGALDYGGGEDGPYGGLGEGGLGGPPGGGAALGGAGGMIGGMMPGGMMPGGMAANHDELIELITSTVEPDSWDVVGGPGTISQFNGLIVVNNNMRVHRGIDQLLDRLREALSEGSEGTPSRESQPARRRGAR